MLTAAEPLRQVASDLRKTAKYFILWIFSFSDENRKKNLEKMSATKYNEHAFVLAMVLTAVGSAYSTWAAWQRDPDSGVCLLVWIYGFFPIALLSLFFVYFVMLNLILLVILVVFRPIEWVFDVSATAVIRLLQKRRLTDILLMLSFVFLALGVFLELLAS